MFFKQNYNIKKILRYSSTTFVDKNIDFLDIGMIILLNKLTDS